MCRSGATVGPSSDLVGVTPFFTGRRRCHHLKGIILVDVQEILHPVLPSIGVDPDPVVEAIFGLFLVEAPWMAKISNSIRLVIVEARSCVGEKEVEAFVGCFLGIEDAELFLCGQGCHDGVPFSYRSNYRPTKR